MRTRLLSTGGAKQFLRSRILILSNIFCAGLEMIAGGSLILMMLLTGCDIVGRALGRPIPGTYEIVSFAGALVLGLAIPVTSRVRAHVFIDLVTSRVSTRTEMILHVITRLTSMALFVLLGYSIFNIGLSLRTAGEYTAVLNLPFYPVALAVGIACFIELVILIGDIVKGGGVHE